MENFFKLVFSEWKLSIKQLTFFFILSTLLFSVSICCLFFTFNLKKNFINQVNFIYSDGIELASETDKISLNKFLEYQHYADMVKIIFYEYSYDLEFIKNNNVFVTNTEDKNYNGQTVLFSNTISKFFDNTLLEGEFWNINDNKPINGIYSIFISDLIAENLNVKTGDIIKLKSISNSYPEADFKIKGIYEYKEIDGIDMPYFIYSFNFCLEKGHEYSPLDNYILYFNSSEKIYSNYFTLKNTHINSISSPVLEEIGITKNSEIILMSLSLILIFSSFALIANSLNIMLKTRQQFIAKLKMLGAASGFITQIYFSIFFIKTILSLIIAFFINLLLNAYYEKVGSSLFQYDFNMTLSWQMLAFILVSSIFILFVFRLIFKNKIKKISAIKYLKG